MFETQKLHEAGAFPGRRSTRSIKMLACSALALIAVSSAAFAQSAGAPDFSGGEPSKYDFVDCRLPGAVVQVGGIHRRQLRGKLVRITAGTCETRGGRYIVSDRASLEGSLAAWLSEASLGDSKAQTYVGELYERGPDGIPDFEMSRMWYERAVKKGYAPAMFNLARLLDEGLGGPADQERAASLYYDAMGLEGDLRDKISLVDPDELEILRASLAERDALIERQESIIEQLSADIDALERELDAAGKRVGAIEQDLASARQQLAQTLSDGASNMDVLRGRLTELEVQRADLETRERALASDEAALARLQQEISTAASSENTEHAATLERLRLELADAHSTIGRLSAEREQAVRAEQAALNALSLAETDLGAQMTKLAERERAIASRETELQDLTSRYGADSLSIRAEREDLQKERALLAAEHAELESQRSAFEAKRLETEQRARDLQLTEAELETERARLQDQSDELRVAAANAVSLSAERADLQNRMNRIALQKQELDALQTSYKDRLASVLGREASLEETKAELEMRLAAVQNNEAEIDRLSAELIAATARAVRAEESRDEANAKLKNIRDVAQRGSALPDPNEVAPITHRDMPDVDFGNYHAILIGNQNYEHDGWEDLLTPHKDVDEISKILETRYNFETTVLKDVRNDEFRIALYEVTSKMGERDNLLIYFAGHGQLFADANRAFWEPIDSTPNRPFKSIENEYIKQVLVQSSAKKVLVIADSCYSGTLTRSPISVLSEKNLSPEARTAHIKDIIGQRSRIAFTSGGVQPVADNGGDGNSIFASALIQELNGAYNIFSAHDLAVEVKRKVTVSALNLYHDQQPQYSKIDQASHHGGDFIFVPVLRP